MLEAIPKQSNGSCTASGRHVVEMRLVHIFEMRDGKISKEIVFDMGHPL
jgi:hypothetical protein